MVRWAFCIVKCDAMIYCSWFNRIVGVTCSALECAKSMYSYAPPCDCFIYQFSSNIKSINILFSLVNCNCWSEAVTLNTLFPAADIDQQNIYFFFVCTTYTYTWCIAHTTYNCLFTCGSSPITTFTCSKWTLYGFICIYNIANLFFYFSFVFINNTKFTYNCIC